MCLVFAQLSCCICYTIFLGQQIDLLVCDSMMVADCGFWRFYAVLITLTLLPVFMLKNLRYKSYFSTFANVMTVLALSFILFYSFSIIANRKVE